MSTLFNIFENQHVSVVTKTRYSETNETSDGIATTNTPIVRNGWVVDIDDEWIYLGDSALLVHIAISRKDVSSIELSEPTEEGQEKDNVLKMLPKPPDDKLH